MQALNEFSTVFSQLPVPHLVVAVILAGFALAAFAISAVLTIVKKGDRG